ncbi:pyridoxal phosphate-dependent transferase [Aspergillus fumigatus]
MVGLPRCPVALMPGIKPRDEVILPSNTRPLTANTFLLRANIACARDIYVVEVGTMGQLGCISFQEENITAAGQGDALLVNDLAVVERTEIIWNKRMMHDVSVETWQLELKGLETLGIIELPAFPPGREHNARIFWIKVPDTAEQREFMESEEGVGISIGPDTNHRHVINEDVVTRESERLGRLPMSYAMTLDDARFVIDRIRQFYSAGKVVSTGISR